MVKWIKRIAVILVIVIAAVLAYVKLHASKCRQA